MSNHLQQFAVNSFTIVESERLISANSKIFISKILSKYSLKFFNN